MAYTEGQRLQGSDGQIYVVHGGVPVLESTAPAGPVTLGTPKPSYQYEGPQAAARLTQTQQEIAASEASQAHTALENRRMLAQAPTDAAMAAANLTKAQAEAAVAQQKADQAKAEQSLATMAPNSQLHGEAYLQKFVPPAMQAVVRAYARGDLGSKAGGMSTSMLPIIQHAMNYDPSVSATTFPARAKMQADLAGSQPGTAGGSLRAMERMLLHGQEVLNSGQKLDNFGPGIVGSVANAFRTGYQQHAHDPRISGYEEQVRNYAPEAQKAIAQTSGGQAERAERGDAFGASLPQAARVAALQGDARQAFDAMGAVNDQYKRLMGHDILDQLSPAARKAYDNIMAGGYDASGKALHPADGYVPGSGLAGVGGGPSGGIGGPGDNTPPAGLTGGGTIATGATKAVTDPNRSKAVEALLRSGADFATVNAVNKQMGGMDLDPQQIAAAQTFLKQHPEAHVRVDTTGQAPTTAFNRFAASPIGLGIIDAGAMAGSGLNAASGGIVNRLTGGAVDQVGAYAPKSAIVGDLAGGALGAAGGEALLGNLGARAGAGLAGRVLSSPITADALFGGVSGANADPNAGLGRSLTNGVLGAGLGAGGGMFGRGVVAPALASVANGVQSGAVRGLRAAGVPLTAGQAAGGVLKTIEDGMTSIPVVGNVIANRRREGMQAFNRAAFDEGLAPIGATTNGLTNEAGVDAARAARSAEYRRVLDPVTLTPDAQFNADIAAAQARGAALPADVAGRVDSNITLAGQNIDPATNTLTGNGYQQAIRRFRRETRSNANVPNGYDVGQVLGDAENAYSGLLGRQSPGTLPAYDAANEANRNVEVLRSAVNAARNGTRTGEPGLFAPSQLADAAAANSRTYGNTAGTTQQPFFDLSRAGQEVLPSKLGDSGTATRALIMTAPALLAGTTGAGYAAGSPSAGAETGAGALALGALLAAGGSRAGQRALTSALIDRPQIALRIGNGIQQRAALGGMFGAGIGSALPSIYGSPMP